MAEENMSKEEYSIVRIVSDGDIVVLDDGSRYSISPEDRQKCVQWQANQRILVTRLLPGPIYECALTNLDILGDEAVKAHKL